VTPEQEIQELRALLAARDAELLAARREAEQLRARLAAAEEGMKRLERELAKLRREFLGPTSERLDPNRLVLPEPDPEPTDAGGAAASDGGSGEKPAAGSGTSTTPDDGAKGNPKDPAEKGKKGKRGPYNWKNRTKNTRRKVSEMDHLDTIEHTSTVSDRSCPCGCGAQAVTIGHEVSWRLERVPARLVRHKIVRETVAWPEHARQEGTTVPAVTAPAPVAYALPGALCGNQLLAEVVVDKYCDHLPAYRQSERFEREGIELSRSTIVDWFMAFAILLRPIVTWLSDQVRGGGWLRADATGMPVLDPPKVKGKAHHGHLWAWGNYETVIFEYTDNKRAETVAALFKDFRGLVLIDGATDFNLLEKAEGITRAGCWAHARRKLYEALPYDSLRALTGLAAIRQLFVAERVVMAAPLDKRLALRDELCRPILAGIRQWVNEELPRAVPRQPMHAALQYLDNQWERLTVFLDHAVLASHNNATENDLRRPVKGRDNYMFAGSPRGAEAAAVFYSLVGTCLLQGIDPKRYLVEIAGRLDEPVSRLTPHAVREKWEAASAARAARSTGAATG
jgi:transposase